MKRYSFRGMIRGLFVGAFFGVKYADLASCWDACRKALSDNKLAVIQTTEPDDERVVVITTLVHSSGEWIRGKISMSPKDTTPQGIGSCVTYARRYSLCGMVDIAPAEDDGNEASKVVTAQSKPVLGLRVQSLINRVATATKEDCLSIQSDRIASAKKGEITKEEHETVINNKLYLN